MTDCKEGKYCSNPKCTNNHPKGYWPKCENYEDCNDENCEKQHAYDKPCNVTMKGYRCKFGDNCKYSHDETVLNWWRERNANKYHTKTQPCKYFSNGHCKNGSNCKFLHDSNKVVSEVDIPNGASRQNMNPEQKSAPASTQVFCYHYEQGRCDYGEKCNKIHDPRRLRVKGTSEVAVKAAINHEEVAKVKVGGMTIECSPSLAILMQQMAIASKKS